jgi:hypothetical protein
VIVTPLRRRTSLSTVGRQRDLPVVLAPDEIVNLVGWWDASQLNLSPDDAVSSWPDLASSYDLDQATGSLQPLYKLLNGVPVVRFDGTDDYLRSTTAPAIGVGTWVVCFSYHSTPAANSGVLSAGSSGQNDYNGSNGFAIHRHVSTADMVVGIRLDSVAGSTANLPGFSVGAKIQGAFLSARATSLCAWSMIRMPGGDGWASSRLVWGTGTPTDLVLGARWLSGAPASPYGSIDVAEVCYWSRSLTPVEFSGFNNYLRIKYQHA